MLFPRLRVKQKKFFQGFTVTVLGWSCQCRLSALSPTPVGGGVQLLRLALLPVMLIFI